METLDYEMYYGIPWPDSQKYQDLDPKMKHWYAACDDDDSSIFAEVDWVNSIRQFNNN